MSCLHSAAWWRRHWERTDLMTIEVADTMPEGWQAWLNWQRAVAPENATEIEAVQIDRGRFIGYVRLVGADGPTRGWTTRLLPFPRTTRESRCCVSRNELTQ